MGKSNNYFWLYGNISVILGLKSIIMNILFLTHNLNINHNPAAIADSHFIAALSSCGHKVSIIVDELEDENVSWLTYEKLIHIRKEKSLPFYHRIPKLGAIPFYLDGIPGRFKTKIPEWRRIIEVELKENHYDLIISSGSIIFPHLMFKFFKNSVPWIINIHDPMPFSTYPPPYFYRENLKWNSEGLYYRRLELLVKNIFRNATQIFMPSLLLKERLEKFYGKLEKVSIIPHVHTELRHLPTQEDDNVLDERLNDFIQAGDFVIIHAGRLYKNRKIEPFLKALESFISNKKIKFIQVGEVSDENKKIIHSFKSLNQQILVFEKRISYKKSLELIERSDAALIIELDNDESPFLPSKFSDILFFQKPMIALTPKKSEIRRLLGVGYPFIASPNDQEEIQHVLDRLLNVQKKCYSSELIDKIKPKYLCERIRM